MSTGSALASTTPARADGRALLGFASEQQHDVAEEVIRAAEAAARDLGIAAPRVATEADEAGVDTLIAVGFPHYYPDLLRRPRRAHRILWYGEPLPSRGRGALPALLQAVPVAGLADALMRLAPPLSRVASVRALRGRAAAERVCARNLRELRRVARAFDEIALSSAQRVRAAAAAGVAARVVPFGYHPSTGGPLAPVDPAGRDVPVLVLGTELDGSTRRATVLRTLRRALEPAVPLTLVGAGLYGEERAGLLRRTRILLDVHRVPGAFTGLRFMMAAAAGAIFVTEPFEGATPLVPGVHHVEATADRLPDAIRSVLRSDALARRIAEAAQSLLRGDLAMASCLRRLAPLPA